MSDQNISNFVGEDAEKNITVTDDDGEEINLTTGTVNEVYLTVSTNTTKYGEEVFEKNPATINNQSTAVFNISSSDTADLRPGNYIYEVWLEYNDGKTYTAEVGKYFLKKKVNE